MYSSLIDAPVNTDLIMLQVTSPRLEAWLQRIGLFTGSKIIRHDKEFNFSPVRVKAEKGDVIIPAGLAMKIYIHLDSGEKIPLTEMKKKEKGHVEILSSGKHAETILARLGLKENSEVVFLRSLPHMDYITVVNKKERTRLSEGEAARIWGHSGDEAHSQFYFAKQQTPFFVKEIMGGKKSCDHLETHGVTPGSELLLEAIEQAQSLHQPVAEPITISSPNGLRIFFTPQKAGQVIVRTESP